MSDLTLTHADRQSRLATVAGVLALAASIALFAWFYLAKRQAFFDDVFIYLHMAHNGAELGTWQYFPLVDRPALLASSPLKITLLTLAAWLTSVAGHFERSFEAAKLTLVVYAPLAWLMWWPFWRDRIAPYLWLGAVYFLCAIALDATIDFEGGLLLLWVATLVMLLGEAERRYAALGWAIPIGLLIRPDVAIPVIAAVVAVLGLRHLKLLLAQAVLAAAVIAAAWLQVAWLMDVWPIPATYWAKAAIPKMFEEKYMIELFFERIGWVTGFRLLKTPAAAVALGVLVIVGFLLSVVRDSRSRIAAAITSVVVVGLLYKAPANFWWYYQNVVLTLLGVALGIVARQRLVVSWQRSAATITPPLAFACFLMVVLMFGKAGQDGPHLWNVNTPSRAQGYQYLASRALGDGTYDLPDIGRVFIKNPEMGMPNYFAGARGWIWDSAGLAQPLDDPKVSSSLLRHFFPASVQRSARTDAMWLAERAGVPLRVVEVWAMEDRNFEAARKACRYVIVEGAICANDFQVH